MGNLENQDRNACVYPEKTGYSSCVGKTTCSGAIKSILDMAKSGSKEGFKKIKSRTDSYKNCPGV